MDSISKKWAILVCSLICVNRALSAGRHSIHLENEQKFRKMVVITVKDVAYGGTMQARES